MTPMQRQTEVKSTLRRGTRAWRKLAVAALMLGAAPIAFAGAAQAATDRMDELPDGMYREPVEQSLLDTVSEVLPEGRNVDASFLNPSYAPMVTLNQDAGVYTTFLDEGAGYRISLGYFAYSGSALDGLSKADVDTDGSGVVSLSEFSAISGVETGYVFPNASKQWAGGQLVAGDTVQIGDGKRFDAGTISASF